MSLPYALPSFEPEANERPTVPAKDLAPTWLELGALGVQFLLVLSLYLTEGYRAINILSPLLLTAILAAAMWELARRHVTALWTPIFLVRLASALFLGIGGILPMLFGPVFLEYLLGLYAFTDEEAAKVNLIWLVSTALILAAARLSLTAGLQKIQVRPAADDSNALSIGVAFWLIGLGSILLGEGAQSLGLVSLTLPGSVSSLMQALHAGGIFLIALWGVSAGVRGAAAITILFTLSLLMALLFFNKTVIILPQLVISIAYLIKGVTLRRLALVSVFFIFSFSVLQPIVAFQRQQQYELYGETPVFNPTERLGFAAYWVTASSDEVEPDPTSLTRLSHLAPASFIVSQFDQNRPSDSIEGALAALIPRAIWPDKPEISAVGRDLYYLLTGRDTSQLATTVAADIYWNLGWPGVIFLSVFMGLLVGPASTVCFLIVAERDWLMMPFVLLCFRISVAVESPFVSAIFGPVAIAFVLYWGLRAAKAVMADLPGSRRRQRLS